MRTLAPIALLLLILWSSPTHSQGGGESNSFQLRVNGVEGVALSIAVADILTRDIAVGPFLPRSRLDINSEYGSYEEFLEELSKSLPAKYSQYDGILVLKHPCLGDPFDQLPDSSWREQISLHFQHAVLRNVMDEVGSFNALRLHPISSAEMALQQDISMRMKEKTLRSAFHTLAFASGLQLTEEPDRSLRVERVASKSGCKLPSTVPESRSALHSAAARAAARCPDGADGKPVPKCEPLELFESQSLVARGFAVYRGQRFAVVESPDSHLWAVKLGAYVGHDFGKIVEISDDGVALVEVVLSEDDDGYVEKKRLLPYPRPNPSIKGMSNSELRLQSAAPHVKR